tara:strand:+ start:237 stop:515 length:279 start_codon:yes stop_codon:yes gene_type:complete
MFQKIVNGIAIASGVVSLAVVGTAGYVYIRKDAIIKDIKGKVMESVMPDVGGAVGALIPSFTGPAGPPTNPTADAPSEGPMPDGAGLGIPNF